SIYSSPPPATAHLYPLSLHDALPISSPMCFGDSPAEGSSSISTLGGTVSAQAKASICRWPPLRFPACVLWCAASSGNRPATSSRSEEHTSELQSRGHLVCRLLLEKKK